MTDNKQDRAGLHVYILRYFIPTLNNYGFRKNFYNLQIDYNFSKKKLTILLDIIHLNGLNIIIISIVM